MAENISEKQVPKILRAEKITYQPATDALENIEEYLISKTPKAISKALGLANTRPSAKIISSASFDAEPFKVTGIIGGEKSTRKTLLDILVGHRKYGLLGGNIYLSDLNDGRFVQGQCNQNAPNLVKTFEYYNNVAFIPRRSLHYVGLTYLEVLEYAAQLRLSGNYSYKQRARELLMFFGLMDKMNCLVPEGNKHRGEIGAELRLLTFAIELITNCPVIIVDDPLRDVDSEHEHQIMGYLKELAKEGHTVICSLSSPEPLSFDALDDIVLLGGSSLIYSGMRAKAKEYFSSLAIECPEGIHQSDFLLKISAEGTSSASEGYEYTPEELVDLFRQNRPAPEAPNLDASAAFAYDDKGAIRWMFRSTNGLSSALNQVFIMFKRTFLVKWRERDALTKSLMGGIIMSLLVGLMLHGQGDWDSPQNSPYVYRTGTNQLGEDVVFRTPEIYPQIYNINSALFLAASLSIGMQVINVHLIVKKVLIYRYEQRAGYCPPVLFGIVLMFSEMIFAAVPNIVFACILLKLTEIKTSIADYWWFMQLLFMALTLGVFTAVLLTAIFARELIVRDLYLLLTMFMLLLSGYTFNINNMTSDIVNLTELNPMRWLFQALMTWQYEDYTDGILYLSTYGYSKSDKDFVFEYLRNFYYFSGCIYVVMMLPSISRLRRRPRGLDEHLEKPRPSFARDDSIATVSNNFRIRPLDLTVPSPMQEIHAGIPRGANVEFSDISYTYDEFEFSFKNIGRVRKTALDRCSGHFKNGCLNAIIGASGSGRSTLLHILAGSISPHVSGKHFSGSVKYGGKPIDYSIPGWQRNSFVESKSNLLRDISVNDTVGYAWQLRSGAHEGRLSVDTDLVQKILSLVRLDKRSTEKTKNLSPGELRLLSLAEELISGTRKIVFFDEPLTDLDEKDTTKVMHVLKELVKIGYTVVATFHNLSNDVLRDFGSIYMLCKGRMAYSGNVADVCNYFAASPYQLKIKEQSNIAAFLNGISSCTLVNENGKDLFSLLPQPESKLSISAHAKNPIQFSGGLEMRGSKTQAFSDEDVDSDFEAPSEAKKVSLARNVRGSMVKASIILRRAAWSLACRRKLMLGSLLLHALLAFVIIIIVKDVSPYINDTTAYIVITTIMLTFQSVQFIFYLHKCNEVFLKEHSRGLYSYFAMWSVGSLPHYSLKILNSFVFAFIVHDAIGLNHESDRYEFYLLIVATLCVIAGILTEIVVFTSPTVRQAYVNFPVALFLLFYFSSIPVKPSTYVYWMRSWVPSVSVFRWTIQATIINEFEDDPIFLNTRCNSMNPPRCQTFNTYPNYLSVFGFGGKTREFCYGIMFLNLVIFRLISLLALRWTSHRHRGQRHLYKDETFE